MTTDTCVVVHFPFETDFGRPQSAHKFQFTTSIMKNTSKYCQLPSYKVPPFHIDHQYPGEPTGYPRGALPRGFLTLRARNSGKEATKVDCRFGPRVGSEDERFDPGSSGCFDRCLGPLKMRHAHMHRQTIPATHGPHYKTNRITRQIPSTYTRLRGNST